MKRNWWSAAGRPVLESALAVSLAALLAQLFFGAIATTTPHGKGPELAGPEFIVRALSTQLGLLVVSAVVLLVRRGRVPLRITRRGSSWCLLGLVALLSINLLASWGMLRTHEPYLGFPEIPAGAMGILVVLVGAVSAPVTEELFFREALLRRVLASSPRAFAILVSSFEFGALHLGVGGPVLFLALSGMGVVLALVRLRADSLGAAILIHAANNLAAFLLATGGVGSWK